MLVNPAAHNGQGVELARRALSVFESLGVTGYEVVRTEGAGSATDFAFHLDSSVDSLIVLGGDGLVHETVNGLMCRDRDDRPLLGVVPLGSGNDYARALGLPLSVDASVQALCNGLEACVDVGLCNGQFYAETLSFGLDAAIALQTMELRKKTGESGTKLYFHAGIDQLLHHLNTYGYRALVTDAQGETAEIFGSSIVFASQVGPTYGGGFYICPDANLSDGLIDICIAEGPVSVPHAVYVFVRAKNGKHTHMKPIRMLKAKSMHLEFDEEPPAQIDGEPILGTTFDIDCVPQALRVIRAS